jgi:hypothetical protein
MGLEIVPEGAGQSHRQIVDHFEIKPGPFRRSRRRYRSQLGSRLDGSDQVGLPGEALELPDAEAAEDHEGNGDERQQDRQPPRVAPASFRHVRP